MTKSISYETVASNVFDMIHKKIQETRVIGLIGSRSHLGDQSYHQEALGIDEDLGDE